MSEDGIVHKGSRLAGLFSRRKLLDSAVLFDLMSDDGIFPQRFAVGWPVLSMEAFGVSAARFCLRG
jgi:hypothetical protein